MSVSSCLLLFMILCLSLHLSDCRRLGSVEKKKSEDQKFNVSTSKVSNNNTRSDHQHAVEAMHPLPESVKDEKPASGESNSGDSISLNHKTEEIKANKERKRSPRNPKGSSQASISWRVRRHEKPSEKDSELFGSDYSPPKTHPPSHN